MFIFEKPFLEANCVKNADFVYDGKTVIKFKKLNSFKKEEFRYYSNVIGDFYNWSLLYGVVSENNMFKNDDVLYGISEEIYKNLKETFVIFEDIFALPRGTVLRMYVLTKIFYRDFVEEFTLSSINIKPHIFPIDEHLYQINCIHFKFGSDVCLAPISEMCVYDESVISKEKSKYYYCENI